MDSPPLSSLHRGQPGIVQKSVGDGAEDPQRAVHLLVDVGDDGGAELAGHPEEEMAQPSEHGLLDGVVEESAPDAEEMGHKERVMTLQV